MQQTGCHRNESAELIFLNVVVTDRSWLPCTVYLCKIVANFSLYYQQMFCCMLFYPMRKYKYKSPNIYKLYDKKDEQERDYV